VINVSEQYGPIDYAKLAEKLREELDVHSACLGSSMYLGDGLDAHFKAVKWYPGYVKGESAKASDFWTLAEPRVDIDGELVCPLGYDEVVITTRRAFSYPFLNLRTKMPALKTIDSKVDFGLENVAGIGVGTAQFQYRRMSPGTNKLMAYVASSGLSRSADLSWAQPADAETALHYYSIKVNKGLVEFYVDGVLRLVGVRTPNLGFSAISGPPYTILGLPMVASPFMTAQIEPHGYNAEKVVFPLNPFNFFLVDGDPLPPRVYRLYQTGADTLLAGLSLSSGSVTSHPVPVFGYRDKTLYFQANQAGSLLLEVLMQSGGWRTYDSDTVSADTLWWYKMTGDAVLVRLTFTPSAYPCTIAEAEVDLSG
jgi:hypothetical protein